MDQFHKSDPISESNISELHSYLNVVLIDLKTQLDNYKPKQLIGSAGAFETFASMLNPDFKSGFEKPEFNIDLDKFEKISKFIIRSNHEERAVTAGIPAVRVDMIVVATLLTSYVLNLHEFKTLKLSTYSMKEGILFEMI
jgi:exopolyphosphatase/guanosine-5'-triphosphate,3'-diphosphate pyrophosphatase